MLEILYEDNHIIAINKKTSDIVQADKSGDVPLSEEVKAYIKEKYNKPGEVFLGIPHRIDRPVSGVVLFARTTKALTRLNKMFQEHDEEIKKPIGPSSVIFLPKTVLRLSIIWYGIPRKINRMPTTKKKKEVKKPFWNIN